MCGIAGFIQKKKEKLPSVARQEMDDMLAAIRHRGPDDTGVCGISPEHTLIPAERAAGLPEGLRGIFGFDRLSIQDVSMAGHQPMLSPDQKTVLTFNGEIYNVNELREQLKQNGIREFRGHSDTEVILHLYLLYGFETMIGMLNGMFAIALYDARKEKLYIARDRFGIIPVYVQTDGERLVWASEIKCFRHLREFDRQVNRNTFSKLFLCCNPNDAMYAHAKSVEPGYYLEADVERDCRITEHRYFDLNDYRQKRSAGRDYLEECEALIRECVKRQTISDVSLGVQFSGGVDSTLLAKYVKEIYQNRGEKLLGFSLTNRGSAAHDEEPWIDHAASCLNLDIKKFDMDSEHFIANLERSVYAYERFLNEPGPVGVFEFSKNARKDVTVLISGEGADEVCGGYNNFPGFKLCEDIRKVSGPLFRQKFSGVDVSADSDRFLLSFDGQLPEELCRKIFPDYTNEGFLEERRDLVRSFTGTAFDRARKLFFKGELVSLCEKQNKTCMANSVENRVPFLDNELVRYMFEIPERELMHHTYRRMIRSGNMDFSQSYEGKYLLKRLSARTFGDDFAFRTKMALRVPLSSYIQNDRMHEYINGQILPGMRQRGMIDTGYFEKCYGSLNEGENAMVVWKAINAELWCQLFVDGRAVAG